jgi:hypothetical protein
MQNITYDVRIYKTEVRKGSIITTYRTRWKTGPKTWQEPFQNEAQAASFEAELRSAARKGEAFDVTTGRPVSWGRANRHELVRLSHAVKVVDEIDPPALGG